MDRNAESMQDPCNIDPLSAWQLEDIACSLRLSEREGRRNSQGRIYCSVKRDSKDIAHATDLLSRELNQTVRNRTCATAMRGASSVQCTVAPIRRPSAIRAALAALSSGLKHHASVRSCPQASGPWWIIQPKMFPHLQWALHRCVHQLNVIFAPIEVPPGFRCLPGYLIQGLNVGHPLILQPAP